MVLCDCKHAWYIYTTVQKFAVAMILHLFDTVKTVIF